MIAKPDPLNPFSVLYDRAVEKGWFVELTVVPAVYMLGRLMSPPRLGLIRVLSDPKKCEGEERVGGSIRNAATLLLARLGL